MFNKKLSAVEAKEFGIVNRVVPAAALSEDTDKVVQSLANGPTMAYGALKAMMLQTHATSLEAQMETEARAISSMSATRDGSHGIASFASKSTPTFEGT